MSWSHCLFDERYWTHAEMVDFRCLLCLNVCSKFQTKASSLDFAPHFALIEIISILFHLLTSRFRPPTPFSFTVFVVFPRSKPQNSEETAAQLSSSLLSKVHGGGWQHHGPKEASYDVLAANLAEAERGEVKRVGSTCEVVGVGVGSGGGWCFFG